MGTGHLRNDLWEANERTQGQHKRALAELSDNKKYPYTGMFHLTNLRLIQHGDGYQVVFNQDIDEYTPSLYAIAMNEFLRYVPNHEVDVTKENGVPKISFRIPNKRTAFRLARKYGSSSVWDWNNNEELNVRERRRR